MKNEPVIYMTRQMWKHSEGNRVNVVLYITLSVIANIIMFFQPLILAWVLNIIQTEGVSSANIARLIGISSLFILCMIGFWAFHGPSRVLETKNAFYVRAQYKKHMVDGVLSFPPEWHSEHHSGDTIDKIQKGSNAIHHFATGTFEIIDAVIMFAGSLLAIIYFNLGAGALVIFFTVLALQGVLYYDKKLRVHYKEISLAENSTSQKIFDIISNVSTVIILRMEKIASNDIYKKINAPFKTFEKSTKLNEIKWALVSLISSIMVFAVLLAYLLHASIVGSVILIGTVYALYSYVNRVSEMFFRFAYKYSDIVQKKTQFENAEILSNEFSKRSEVRKIKFGKWSNLDIRHLTFSYHKKSEDLHLRDIEMIIRKGEKIAFIGESGSGKTTFLKLIRGLYTPKKIEIILDGKKIEGFENIESDIALIPQDPEIFSATIRENITLGLDINDDLIKRYTNMACFTKVVEKLPKKLESAINEKGVNLSGGEKQRLALSRGLLACEGKEIILLDEPTSSVDSKNESAIYKNIIQNFGDKTIISTIHRLHLLHHFDKIYLFEKGRIVASGSLSQIRKSRQFQELWIKYHKKRTKLST